MGPLAAPPRSVSLSPQTLGATSHESAGDGNPDPSAFPKCAVDLGLAAEALGAFAQVAQALAGAGGLGSVEAASVGGPSGRTGPASSGSWRDRGSWRPSATSSPGSGDEVGPVGDPEVLLADMDQVHGVLEAMTLEGGELAEGNDVVRGRTRGLAGGLMAKA
jgi:hypothetical protein